MNIFFMRKDAQILNDINSLQSQQKYVYKKALSPHKTLPKFKSLKNYTFRFFKLHKKYLALSPIMTSQNIYLDMF